MERLTINGQDKVVNWLVVSRIISYVVTLFVRDANNLYT